MGSNKAFMASTAALLLSLNLLFSTMVTSQQEPPPPMATPPPPPPSCPIETISSSDCLSALNNTTGLIGGAPTIIEGCCSLVGTLVSAVGESQATVCVCTAIQAAGLNLLISALANLLNLCPIPPLKAFQCTTN